MLNEIKQNFKPSPPPLKFEERVEIIVGFSCHSVSSLAFIGWQLHQHKAKLTPLLRKNIHLLFPFGVACGAIQCIGPAVASRVIRIATKSIVAEEKSKELENRLKAENHYQILEKFSFFECCVLAPVVEELLFRGAIQPILVRTIGVYPGIVASSLLFGLSHTLEMTTPTQHEFSKDEAKLSINQDLSSQIQASKAFILGIFMGYVRHHFGLISAIGVHAGHNGAIFSINRLQKN
jgi:membrane protease YdiL (CAAX protease family)